MSDVETVRQAMRAVTNEGWPVPFVWLFDQPWQVVLSIWEEAERILGCPVVNTPTTIFSVCLLLSLLLTAISAVLTRHIVGL